MLIEDLPVRAQAVDKPNGCPRPSWRGPHTSIVSGRGLVPAGAKYGELPAPAVVNRGSRPAASRCAVDKSSRWLIRRTSLNVVAVPFADGDVVTCDSVVADSGAAERNPADPAVHVTRLRI